MARRITQRDIAEMAGVSQATVSLVLNGASSADGRIPQETRDRIMKAIRETGYVADPAARQMAKGRNRILGVFTYEPAFPVAQADFFGPFLLGIEEAAQNLGYDLLLMTAAGQNRKIFGDNSRLRLADGCIVLGRKFDHDELARLVKGDFPFVAVGRRDDAGGPVPYVGGDYPAATARLLSAARALGHERFAYIGPRSGDESTADRWSGFESELAGAPLALADHQVAMPAEAALDAILRSRATCAFFVERAEATAVEALARSRGLNVPKDFSIVVLGNHVRSSLPGRPFTSFSIPREAMGRVATEMLVRRVEDNAPVEQVLLACELVEGDTLGPIPS